MGIVSALFEKRDLSVSDMRAMLQSSGYQTETGITVTPSRSLQAGAVLACVRLLSETVGSLPLHLLRIDGRYRSRATQHAVYRVLHHQGNEEMTAMKVRETIQAHATLRGNGYAYLDWGERGELRGMWPLNPDDVIILRDINDRSLWYSVMMPERFGGEREIVRASYIFHLRGLSPDGLVGYNLVQLARQSIGLDLATEEFGARFFGSGAQPSFVILHPSKLGDKAYEHLQKSWQIRQTGLHNAHKPIIAEEGMKVEKLGIDPDAAQFLETRKFSVSQIARIFRVPPHMIGDLERATFSNIEQQSIDFVQNTLRPWLVNWEQEILLKMLTPRERAFYAARHSVEGLLRGDAQSRYAGYAVARQWGWLSTNDIRELEDLDPVDGGDDYLTPLNMVTRGTESEPSRSLPSLEMLAPVMSDALTRIYKRHAQDLRSAAQAGKLTESWVEQYFLLQTVFVSRQLQPVMRSIARMAGVDETQADGYAEERALVLVERCKKAALDAARAGQFDVIGGYSDAAESDTQIELHRIPWR